MSSAFDLSSTEVPMFICNFILLLHSAPTRVPLPKALVITPLPSTCPKTMISC